VATTTAPELQDFVFQSLHWASEKGVQQAAFTSASAWDPPTSALNFSRSKNLVSSAQPPPAACERSHTAEKELQVGTELQHVCKEQVEGIAPAHWGVSPFSVYPLGQTYWLLTMCNMPGAAKTQRRRAILMLRKTYTRMRCRC